MKNVLKYFVMVVSCTFMSLTYAGFGDLAKGALGGDKKGGKSSGVSLDSTVNSQDDIVKKYVSAMGSINQAQGLMAEALGLKGASAGIEDANKAISGGAVVDADAIKKFSKSSSKANKAIAKKMKAGEDLSDESKKLLAASVLPYANGLMETQEMISSFKPFLNSAASVLKDAPMMEKVKLKSKLKSGMFVAKETPGLLKELMSTSSLLMDYTKSQNADVPKEATDKMGDL